MLRFTVLAGCVAAPFAAFIISDMQIPHRIRTLAPRSEQRDIEPIKWRGEIQTELPGH